MKKIAMLTDGWKRLLVYAWVDGLMRRAKEVREEICLYHYNCFGNWSTDERNNQGEYNIFNLPDLTQFDGIIMDCNNIRDKGQLQHLFKLLRASGVPVLSINYDAPGFHYVGIDNREPIRRMMDHLYEVHGCRSFLFAGGPPSNYENQQRALAYRQRLEKFGLMEEKNPVWYRDYDFESGVIHMNQLHEKVLAGTMEMPQAIISASDNIAVGICTRAKELDYRVPEDFRVTGFDNLDKAAYFQPQITTVGHVREEIGEKCLDVLQQIWRGSEKGCYHYISSECFFSESCGCPRSNGYLDTREGNYRIYMKNKVTSGIQKDKEDLMLMDLETDMSRCSTYEEMFAQMGDFMKSYDCDGFFLVTDRRLFLAETDTAFSVSGYPKEEMQVVCARDFEKERSAAQNKAQMNGQPSIHIPDTQPAIHTPNAQPAIHTTNPQLTIHTLDDLEAYMNENGGGSEFLFTPIHFKEQTVGYSILKNGRFLYANPYYYNIHCILVREMEALYYRKQLEGMNRKLRDLYNRDQLTGLYNRIAYHERMEPEFAAYDQAEIVCSVIFIDIDHFKKINDTCGHKFGDEVIRKVAGLTKNHCPENGMSFRYGGDEFVMFLPDMNREAAERLRTAMRQEAQAMNVEISIGIAVTEPGSGKTLQMYVEEADGGMYQDKMSRR